MNKQKKISIKDIAKIAGISVSSVSRILNKTGRYSKKTEQRVLQIVDEYGYVTNMAAKSLRSLQSKSIGLMVPDITNEFFSKIAYFCETYLHKKGYTLFICNTNTDPDKEYIYLNDFVSKNIDGIIAISKLTNIPKSLLNANIPIVTLDRISTEKKNIPYVISDEHAGIYKSTELLIQKGCKSIIVIIPGNNNYLDPRALGAMKAMQNYNISFNPQNSLFFINISEQSISNSELLMSRLLNNNIFIDGVVCGSDKIALGVSYAINKHNLQIPQDIKIIGFDNTLYSKLSIPPISTVERNSQLLSESACNILLNLINKTDPNITSIVIPTQLIQRESTA